MVATLQELWIAVTAAYPGPPTAVVLASAGVALLVVLWQVPWSRARHAVTIVHEAGHALVALLTGRRLVAIRLHSDTSGLTVWRGANRGPGMVLTLLAGYTAAAALGLGAAALLRAGYVTALLWAILLLLAGVLVKVRNGFGLWTVLVCGGAVALTAWQLPLAWQSAVAYALTWFLLLAAPRTVWELAVERRRSGARGSDADQLAQLTRLPAGVWVTVMLALNVGALLLAGAWLLPDLTLVSPA